MSKVLYLQCSHHVWSVESYTQQRMRVGVLHGHTVLTPHLLAVYMELLSVTSQVVNCCHSLCVTYNPITNESVAGLCLYSCIAHLREVTSGYPLPMTRDNFTNLTWKREGPRALCSHCIPGYGIPLHSYYLNCIKCSSSFQVKEVFRFLAVSLIPPTVLCIVATVLHLNVLRPPWSVFVFVAQTMSTPLVMQTLTNDIYEYDIPQ